VRRVLLAALVIAGAAPAWAVGLEGGDGPTRVVTGAGVGWDNVSGVGRDGYLVAELFGHGERRLWQWFALGGGLSLRGDVANYNHALGRWRDGAWGLGAQLTVGYDGPFVHLSFGPSWTGDRREVSSFRGGILPIGVVRLRIGRQDALHVALRLIDEVPAATRGGAIALRADLALPPRNRHRLRFGVYTSAAEWTTGLSISDEWPFPHPLLPHHALRISLYAGSSLSHLRPELTATAALVF
jgi:hypothetical protein